MSKLSELAKKQAELWRDNKEEWYSFGDGKYVLRLPPSVYYGMIDLFEALAEMGDKTNY